MPKRFNLREIAAAARPLVTPVAHDALSARLIASAGFKAIAIGGSSMLASRFGLPDLGLAALGEMVDGAREIVAATDLPCIIDADDGYGDVRSVARTMDAYQRMGVAGVILEDQAREAKRPGDSKAVGLVTPDAYVEKLKAAIDARRDPDLLIIARSDSYGLEGIDGALRRGERYLREGADGIFIPAMASAADIERAGNAFRGAWQLVVMTEGGRVPLIPPSQLHAWGFTQVAYPSWMILRTAHALASALDELKALVAGAPAPAAPKFEASAARKIFEEGVRLADWEALQRPKS